MFITLAVLIVCIIFFIIGKVRADLVALCGLIVLILTGVLTPKEAFSSFSDPLVLMVIGLFIVSGAILRTGLAKMIGSKMLKLAGTSENKLFFLIIIVTTFIGAFISNSGTVALMMPIVVGMAMQSEVNIRRLLMPLAFAGSMGGMFTLIGTPPNLVIEGVLRQQGFTDLKFFSFAPVGLTVFIVGTIGFWLMSKIFLSKKVDIKANKESKSLKELTEEYNILNKTFILQVSKNSPFIGKTLRELRIPEKYDIIISKVMGRGKKDKQFVFASVEVSEVAGPSTVMKLGNMIEVIGSKENIEKFILENVLTMISDKDDGELDSGIAEAVLLPNSKLINVRIRDSEFRKKYNVNILAINHHGEYKSDNLAEDTMRSGDAILVQGKWEDLARLNKDYENIVLIGQPLEEASKVTLDHKAPLAAIIMILMIISMAMNILSPVVAIICAALLVVITGCLRNMEEAYKLINWEGVVLLAAMLPMSIALQKTGAADLVSMQLIGSLGDKGPYMLLAGIYFCTSFLTLFISNTATAVLFAPIAFQVAESMKVSPYPLLMAVTVAASMCFASPFSTSSNVMVMTPGRYKFMDYIKVGGPMQIVMGIVMIFVLPLIFPF